MSFMIGESFIINQNLQLISKEFLSILRCHLRSLNQRDSFRHPLFLQELL